MSRKAMEEYIYTLCDDMDKTGANRKRYESLFASMTSKEFYDYMKKFIASKDLNFKIVYKPMDGTPTTEFFDKVAKKRGVSFYTTVYKPYLNPSDPENAPGTAEEVMVLPLNLKRLSQTVMSKTSTSVSITDRNMETGQVKDSDKHARLSDVEVIALLAQNQNATVAEYMNPRADDIKMLKQMLLDISEKGEVSLIDLQSDATNKTAINTMNYYMLGAFLTTNLIDKNSYMLPYTMNKRD